MDCWESYKWLSFVLCRILIGQQKSTYGGLKDTCLGMVADHIQSPHLMSFLVDIYEEEALDKENSQRQDSLSQALEVNMIVQSACEVSFDFVHLDEDV